jgi:rSAM-partnered protein
MVEKPDRSRVGEYERDATEHEWEVFVRDETTEPLRHVGSLTAPDADVAYEQGTKLFGWYAADIWVCRADDMHRFSTHDLDENATPAPIETGGEPRTYE